MIGGRVRARPDAEHFNDHVDSTRNEVFDPATSQWSSRAPAPTARDSAASAVIGGKIYVVGGRTFTRNPDGTTAQVNLPNLEVYDPARDRWETREHRVFANAWIYEPAMNLGRALPDLPTARHGLGAAAVGNRIHTFGGGTQTGGNFATDLNEVLVIGGPHRGA